MRLRDIEYVLHKEIENIRIEYNDIGNGRASIDNVANTMEALERLKEFNFLKERIIEIEHDLPRIYRYRSDMEMVISASQAGSLINYLNRIINDIEVALDVIQQAIEPEQDYAISVKLPQYSDLPRIAKFMTDLNNALEMAIVNNEIDGKVELQTFDSGSLWLGISVGSALAMKIIGNIVKFGVEIKYQLYKLEETKKSVQIYGASADFISNLEKVAGELIDEYVKAHTKELSENNKLSNDPEYIARLERSIKMFGELIYKGAEIRPSLEAPQELRVEYPNYQLQESKQDTKQLLESAEQTRGTEE